jgi:two-component system chemotaxis response regulator CheB
MGEDGAQGLLEIHRAGGVTLGQSEASCVVFGMPQAAARLGAVSRLLPVEDLGPAIWELAGPASPPLPTQTAPEKAPP